MVCVIRHHRVVVQATLLHAYPACWGSINSALKHSSVKESHSACMAIVTPTATQLTEDAKETLFKRIMYNEHHVLQQFLPDVNSHSYSLYSSTSMAFLATKTDVPIFITRQLFTNIYWTPAYQFEWCICSSFSSCFILSQCTQLRSGQLNNKALIDWLH